MHNSKLRESFLAMFLFLCSEGLTIEGCEEYVERCKCMLEQMRQVCPQMETDGLCNIWIIKPGAMSRGRGDFVKVNGVKDIAKLFNSLLTYCSRYNVHEQAG